MSNLDIKVRYDGGWQPGRLLNPYLGETFATLDEAKAWVAEEESDRYMDIVYFEVYPVDPASVPCPLHQSKETA